MKEMALIIAKGRTYDTEEADKREEVSTGSAYEEQGQGVFGKRSGQGWQRPNTKSHQMT